MADIYSPNFFGDVKLAGSAGTAGQTLRSAGSGNQAVWGSAAVSLGWTGNTLNVTVDGTSVNQALNLISADAGNVATAGTDGRVLVSNATLGRKFTFTSASNTSHTITHNLSNQYPAVTVYNSATGKVVIPSDITGTNANTLTITFAVAVAIAGTVVG